MPEAPDRPNENPEPIKAAFRQVRDLHKAQIIANSSQAIQNAILIHLTLHPGTRPHELAEMLGLTVHRTANALKHLATTRLVTAMDDPNNRRHRNYYTTRTGNEEVCRLVRSRVTIHPLDLPHLVLGRVRCRHPVLSEGQAEQRTH